LPKNAKESVDLPDFAKESVAQIQILYTFQAHAAKGRRTKQNVGAPGEKPAHPACMERRVEHGSKGAPLTESDFCLRGPSPQNLHN